MSYRCFPRHTALMPLWSRLGELYLTCRGNLTAILYAAGPQRSKTWTAMFLLISAFTFPKAASVFFQHVPHWLQSSLQPGLPLDYVGSGGHMMACAASSSQAPIEYYDFEDDDDEYQDIWDVNQDKLSRAEGSEHEQLAEERKLVPDRPHFHRAERSAGPRLAMEIETNLARCDRFWVAHSDDSYKACIKMIGSEEVEALSQNMEQGLYTIAFVKGCIWSMSRRVVAAREARGRREPNPWDTMAEMYSLSDAAPASLSDHMAGNQALHNAEASMSPKASCATSPAQQAAADMRGPYASHASSTGRWRAWMFDPEASQINAWYLELRQLVLQGDKAAIQHHLEDCMLDPWDGSCQMVTAWLQSSYSLAGEQHGSSHQANSMHHKLHLQDQSHAPGLQSHAVCCASLVWHGRCCKGAPCELRRSALCKALLSCIWHVRNLHRLQNSWVKVLMLVMKTMLK